MENLELLEESRQFSNLENSKTPYKIHKDLKSLANSEYFSELFLRTDVIEKKLDKGIKNIYFSEDGLTSRVENIALQYYKEKIGWQGFHSENTILPSLYGLYLWNEIFYDRIPYVF